MDVNVHPTKQEVRFENPEAVYNTVFEAVTEVLSGKALIHRAEPAEKNPEDEKNKNKYIPEPFEVARKKAEQTIGNAGRNDKNVSSKSAIKSVDNSESNNTGNNKIEYNIDEKSLRPGIDNKAETRILSDFNADSINTDNEKYQTSAENINGRIKSETIGISELSSQEENDSKSESVNIVAEDSEYDAGKSGVRYIQQTLFDNAEHIETRQEFNNIFSKGYRIVGQIFETYWIIECAGCVYIIDQHAAHEKILYEKFMANVGTDDSTQLLSPPIIISLSSIEEETAERYSEELAKNGFVLEHFGGHEYALSEIPLNLYGLEPKAFLLELLDELSKDLKGTIIKSIKEKIATCACKAAVKGNMEMSELEAKELLKQLLSAENPFNCPHGRPIIIDVTKKEIEKKFKRIL